MSDQETLPITWNPELEQLLAEEGEKALGSSWLHNQCEAYYAQRHQWITIPCVILSTLSGAGSIGSQTMFEDGKSASLSIGAVSIFVGILQTLASFWGFAKLQEAHRNADIQWSKLHRFIAVEMTLPRQERITAKDMLKICRETIERLSESSPLIPDAITHNFTKKFGKSYPTVAVPDVANGLKKITINSHQTGLTPHFSLNKPPAPVDAQHPNGTGRIDAQRDRGFDSGLDMVASSQEDDGQTVVQIPGQGES
jgi:hypothetical protein